MRRGVGAGWVYFQIRNAVPHYFAESSTLSLCRHATRGPRSVVDVDMTPARDDCPICWDLMKSADDYATFCAPHRTLTRQEYARAMNSSPEDPDPAEPDTPDVPPA